MSQRQERKRLDMLNSLKSLTGPFTDAVEVVKYLAEPTLSEKVKQQRLKVGGSVCQREHYFTP